VDGKGPIQLPAGTSIVELHYAARSFATPGEVTYRCRLRGLDDEWRDTGTLSQASFQQLEPGDYEFEVVASNRYGKTFPQPAALKLTMLPFWWQRTDARLLIALALAGALALLVKMRLNALRARFALHEEFSRQLIISQEQERRRIAGEIHDSLGQNLLIAKNQLYLARQMECPDAVQGKLAQVGGSVDDALNEARAISHRLRPFQLERLGLAKAMRAVVRETSESTRIPIEARIESVDGLLPSESETMLFRVLQEALSNVIKHADASKVGVHVAKSGTRIRMRIEDDGRGFDVKSMLDPGRGTAGLGLAGFKERAHLLHGTFHCHSAPGEGTVLTFEIPIPDTPKHEAKS
jgi:signal transduction histidine kinase